MYNRIKVAICDDNQKFCVELKDMISDYWKKYKLTFSIFNSGEALLQSKEKYDCIFLDIEMIDLNGVEVATQIRSYDMDTYIVIVSGFPKYKNIAYKLHVFDYLDKPIDKIVLFKTLDDLSLLLKKNKEESYVSFHTDQGIVKINVKNILYFEYKNRKIILFTQDGKKYQFYDTITKLEENFEKFQFISPHKAFLINPSFIRNIKTNDLIMENQAIIPVSKLKRKQVRKRYFEFISQEMD